MRPAIAAFMLKLTIALILSAMALIGVKADTQAQDAPAPLKIVATTSMIADAARQVGGDLVEVRALMGPGVDPHAYRQTRSDIVAMVRADMVLWHGLFLEAQMQDFLTDLARRKPVIALAEQLPTQLLTAHDDYADKFDPHVWMNPALWRGVVTALADRLIDIRPEYEAIFRANLKTHLQDIDRLATYSTQILGTVPEQSRVLVTAHDAFNYFGQAYGFDVLGIQGISTESEAGLFQINGLVNTLVDGQIKAVFVESSVSDRNIKALIEGAAAQDHKVAIGGELFSDAMGQADTYRGTYIGMIDHNVTTIARALGGVAPTGGMDGKLDKGLAHAQ